MAGWGRGRSQTEREEGREAGEDITAHQCSVSPSGRMLSEAMRLAWLTAMSLQARLPPGREAAQVISPTVAAAPSGAVKTASGLMEAAPAARASAEISAVRRTLKTPGERGGGRGERVSVCVSGSVGGGGV